MSPLVLADGGWASVAEADHAIHLSAAAVGGHPDEVVAATHVLRAPEGRRLCLVTTAPLPVVAFALPGARIVLEGDVLAPDPAADVLAAHTARRSGRLVAFRGASRLRGRRTAGQVVADSSVEAVVALAGTEVGDDSEIDLGDFARPVWRDGRCELVVQPGRGALVPFESPRQIPCCAGH